MCDSGIFKVGIKCKNHYAKANALLNEGKNETKNRVGVSKLINNSLPKKKNAFFIEGGGTKGIYAIGVLKYLFEDNAYINLSDVCIFGGTSVGSYLATVLSLGYKKDDLMEISKIIDMSRLIDSKYLILLTAYRFISKGYFYDDIARTDIIEKILNFKFDLIKKHLCLPYDSKAKDLTFGNLKQLIIRYPNIYKHLIINTVDISKNSQIFMTTLNDESDDIKLFDAMLASSAIPFVFKPVIIYNDPKTNRYTYDKINNLTLNNLVDGGISTNNPLDYFLLNDECFKEYELWLLKFTNEPNYIKIDGTTTLLKQIVEYLISGKNDIKMDLIHDEYQINIINLYSSAGTFDIYTPDEIQKIIENIYNQCKSGKLYFGN
ncbi:MAG: phospholipase [Satyrvirus sp.]|uniref:Phospholipase n=1 Tax=Satyrvirus sp. TaxID=2487771 RepID=A0A3G5ACI9_9VIRU|nr:MAG: phospholipase [Satyrvirus sp.]